jgi:hypothetical protein
VAGLPNPAVDALSAHAEDDRVPTTGKEPSRWIAATPFAITWLPAAIAALYLKYATLRNGFRLAARHFGRVDTAPFTLLERLSFFRGDLLACVVLAPLALVALGRFLPSRWRAPTIIAVSLGSLLLVYVNALAFATIGRPISARLFWAAISWGSANPQSISSHVHASGLLRVGALIIAVLVIPRWSTRQSKLIEESSTARRRWRRLAGIGLAAMALIAGIPWFATLPSTSYHTSVFLRCLEAFVGLEEQTGTSREFAGLAPNQLADRYRALADAPLPERDVRYWKKASGFDVIFFVLETGPAECLPIEGDLDDFPNLRRLRESSFVSSHHYSTYPYTSRAHFSIFSSWYPSNSNVDFIQEYPDLQIPGIMRILSAAGYQTASYSQHASRMDPDDGQMYRALGFGRQQVTAPRDPRELLVDHESAYTRMRSSDSEAFELLRVDLEGWLKREERFAIAFLPLQSHGPWIDLSTDGHVDNVVQRGRAILARQDTYLGEILRSLENHHRLEQTLIVVTADHGIRNRVEDPSLQGAMIDDYSFRVPLLIYAPQVLRSTKSTDWITSHIDIQPTILDLLGVEHDRNFEQGSPVWDSRLARRKTFFFAGHYLGADGYHSNGEFFMRSAISDSAYQSKVLHFTSSQMVADGSAVHARITDTIARMAAFQQRWVTAIGRLHR